MILIKEKIQLPALYSVPEESEEIRNELALRGLEVKEITTAAQNEEAGEVVRAMRGHLKEVEAMRQELTKPLLNGQRLLKSLADDHIAPLQEQIKRIEGLGDRFAKDEARRVQGEEQRRLDEIARLEHQRLEAEALAKTVNGTADTHAAEELVEQTITAMETVIVAPMPEVQRSKGQQTRQVLRYEVLDLRLVYSSRPELCTLEIKPSAVNSTCVPEMPVPGLRLWWETKTTYTSRV